MQRADPRGGAGPRGEGCRLRTQCDGVMCVLQRSQWQCREWTVGHGLGRGPHRSFHGSLEWLPQRLRADGLC